MLTITCITREYAAWEEGDDEPEHLGTDVPVDILTFPELVHMLRDFGGGLSQSPLTGPEGAAWAWVEAGYPDDPYPVRAKGWDETQAMQHFHNASDVGMWSKKGFYGRARWAMIHAMIAQCDKQLKGKA